jgi:hypothetical protein
MKRFLSTTVAFSKRMHVIELGQHLARALGELLGRGTAKNLGIADRLQSLVQSELDPIAVQERGCSSPTMPPGFEVKIITTDRVATFGVIKANRYVPLLGGQPSLSRWARIECGRFGFR